jgi:hypothetical protein
MKQPHHRTNSGSRVASMLLLAIMPYLLFSPCSCAVTESTDRQASILDRSTSMMTANDSIAIAAVSSDLQHYDIERLFPFPSTAKERRALVSCQDRVIPYFLFCFSHRFRAHIISCNNIDFFSRSRRRRGRGSDNPKKLILGQVQANHLLPNLPRQLYHLLLRYHLLHQYHPSRHSNLQSLLLHPGRRLHR